MSRAAVYPAARHWDQRYAAEGRLWGDGPSELARLAVARLSPRTARGADGLTILDVGCGYGRDTRYLAAEMGCRVVGLEPSPAALAAARRAARSALDVDYIAGDAAWLAGVDGHAGRYEVVFAAAVYHLLSPGGRRDFAEALATLARPGGLLFLSTLSPRDAQHYAVGEPVRGEERSWVEHVYLHFCTAEELQDDFAAFDLLDLDERSYVERLPGGAAHRHTSWFLEGRRR